MRVIFWSLMKLFEFLEGMQRCNIDRETEFVPSLDFLENWIQSFPQSNLFSTLYIKTSFHSLLLWMQLNYFTLQNSLLSISIRYARPTSHEAMGVGKGGGTGKMINTLNDRVVHQESFFSSSILINSEHYTINPTVISIIKVS